METKIIFKPFLARNLLKRGNSIVDIKPNRENPEKTLFVFNKTDKFLQDLAEITEKKPE